MIIILITDIDNCDGNYYGDDGDDDDNGDCGDWVIMMME